MDYPGTRVARSTQRSLEPASRWAESRKSIAVPGGIRRRGTSKPTCPSPERRFHPRARSHWWASVPGGIVCSIRAPSLARTVSSTSPPRADLASLIDSLKATSAFWKCSDAALPRTPHAPFSVALPAVSPKSSTKPPDLPHRKNRQRLAG